MAIANKGDRGNQSKRYLVGSDETETEIQCQKCNDTVIERIACSGCKLKFCIECANVSNTCFLLFLRVNLRTSDGHVEVVWLHFHPKKIFHMF